MGLHVKHEHDLFIKQVSHVNPNMTRTCLASTYDLFINVLVVSGLRVVLDFATPTRGTSHTEKFEVRALDGHYKYVFF